MDVGRYLVEAHLHEGRPIGELARFHGVHRSWRYKLLGRYRREGEAGLRARSRRPKSSPSAMPTPLADAIVALRTRLLAEGLDAGALTIQWHLARRREQVPSASSIIRVLRRRGLVTPQPRKRPRSSFIRFEAALPNQLWQTVSDPLRLRPRPLSRLRLSDRRAALRHLNPTSILRATMMTACGRTTRPWRRPYRFFSHPQRMNRRLGKTGLT